MESYEHEWIGNSISLSFPSGKVPAESQQLHLEAGTLRYGEVLALGGDFYGVVGQLIHTTMNRAAAIAAQGGEVPYTALNIIPDLDR